MNRREFLKIIATTSAAMAAASCSVTRESDRVFPYLVPPEEEIIPGKPVFYKSTCTECPANCGMIVKAYDKVIDNKHTICPVKLEGMPGHPVNDGGLCIRGQASLTRLYHPERIKVPLLRKGNGQYQKLSWEEAYKKISDALLSAKEQGRKNVFLSGHTTGTLSDLIASFCQQENLERLPEYEPLSYSTIRAANKILFGRNEIPFYNIAASDFLLTVGADIMGTFVSPVSYGKQYSKASQNPDFQWTHIEPHITISGMSADMRLSIKPASEIYVLGYLLKKIAFSKSVKNQIPGSILASLPDLNTNDFTRKTGIAMEQLDAIVNHLEKSSKPILITGELSTASSTGLETALLSGLIQWSTGMINSTIDFSQSENYANVGTLHDIQNLVNQLKGSLIGVIFISRADPVSNAANFGQVFQNASFRVGMAELMNDTLNQCDIILPLSHPLESWGDAVPRKNVVSVIQPCYIILTSSEPLESWGDTVPAKNIVSVIQRSMEPIFNSRIEGDIYLQLMSQLKNQPVKETYQSYLFANWDKSYGSNFAEESLKSGFVTRPASEDSVSLNIGEVAGLFKNINATEPAKTPVLAIVPSLRAYDGRGRVLALLSEIPDPLTTVSWGEWVSISPEMAKSLGDLKDGDEISITSDKGNYKYPVKLQPKLSSDCLMVFRGSITPTTLAIDTRTGDDIWYIENIKIQKTGNWIEMPILSGSTSQEGRGIIRDPKDKKTLEEYTSKAGMYEEIVHPNYRWSMAIDLESCTGCSACVAACYIENNVPVVGAHDHIKGREMSWIRIEPFYEKENYEFVPMLCQHCTYAPCEPVCPVYAAYHNPEGLNAQVYNRCVGTRYCSNNCPYKVRRFNWFEHEWKAPMDRMLNPEMFVRTKGIMEKCTFCVQRIRTAKDGAKDENRLVKDGEVVPACAQTCPANAIVFGNILDKNSKVYQLSQSRRAYRVFDYLGVEPAVHYLHKKETPSGRDKGEGT